MEIIMSSRLEMIARLAQGGSGVADVGTDHAILPIMLRRSGFEGRIVAGDINDGPLTKARLALEQADIDDVELVLSDGLAGIGSDNIDTIVVAGMGGDTITGILDRGLYDTPEWAEKTDYRLILHPVTKPEILRYWLINNGFVITREDQIEDNGVLCQIISASQGESVGYKDSELFVGKYEQVKDGECFKANLDRHIRRFRTAAESLKSADDASLKAWRAMLISMERELIEMKG